MAQTRGTTSGRSVLANRTIIGAFAARPVVLTLAVATTWPFQAVPFALAAAPLRTLALVVDDPA